jgi:protein-S-isoprenylcysteine O-methyltransferase
VPWLLALLALIFMVPMHSPRWFPFLPDTPELAILAVAITASGIAIAVWARVHLGTNWSTLPAVTDRLITSGPYRYVRHPIYTGVLLALLGSALVSEIWWCVGFAAACILFAYRIRAEERLLEDTFPNQYAGYKARSWALVPFVW